MNYTLADQREMFKHRVGASFEETSEEIPGAVLKTIVDVCKRDGQEYGAADIAFIVGDDYVSGVVYQGATGQKFVIIQNYIYLLSEDDTMAGERRKKEREKAREWGYEQYAQYKAIENYKKAHADCSAKVEGYKIFMYQKLVPQWQKKLAKHVYPKWFQKLAKWMCGNRAWHYLGIGLFSATRFIARAFGDMRKYDVEARDRMSLAIGQGLSNIFYAIFFAAPTVGLHRARLLLLKLGVKITVESTGKRRIMNSFVADGFRVTVYSARSFIPGWKHVDVREFKI